MRRRAAFSALWPEVGGGRPEPERDQPPRMDELIDLFTAAADRLGLSEQEAALTAVSWFDVDYWVRLLITALCRREFRDGASLLAEIGEAARKLGDSSPRAHWLDGLTAVLDDEPVVVIDDATGGGFRLTMSGVGDNCQLHTLLADRLIGDPGRGLLAGERPAPEWVAAATTAPPAVPGGTSRRFRLYDGTGAYIYPEGKPADIAPLDGIRVIVLHPPRGDYRWLNGRTYVNMVPSMTLDIVMNADEAAAWRARIVPGRQDDLFGRNPVT
jgi:hypothetical protein